MNLTPIKTLLIKEIKRSLRTPLQTFGAPVITTLLYFLIFGQAIGSRLGDINNLNYTAFILPGLILLNVITIAFQGMGFSIMFSRVIGKTMDDLLVSPMSYLEIATGFITASVVKSLIVGLLIYLTALFFTPLQISHPFYLLTIITLIAACFSFLGFIAGLWAKNFEQLSIFPTFFIMPLTFLGGVFYSLDMLPSFAQKLSLYNPVFYMVNGLRYGFYSISDISPLIAIALTTTLTAILASITWQLLRTGYNLKT